MKTVGIFEAKTRLSELCREVEDSGEPVLILRRGKPMAQLVPAASGEGYAEEVSGSGILDRMEESQARYGPLPENSEILDLRKSGEDRWQRNPLSDYWNDPRPWEEE